MIEHLKIDPGRPMRRCPVTTFQVKVMHLIPDDPAVHANFELGLDPAGFGEVEHHKVIDGATSLFTRNFFKV